MKNIMGAKSIWEIEMKCHEVYSFDDGKKPQVFVIKFSPQSSCCDMLT